MPKYMDTHAMGSITEETLRKLQTAPTDEFGVTHHDILFSKDDDKIWCVLDAPNEEAVRQHHEKAEVHVDWVREVNSTRE